MVGGGERIIAPALVSPFVPDFRSALPDCGKVNSCPGRIQTNAPPRGARSPWRHFRPLLGKPCWGVHYNRPLNLSFNFGEPYLEVYGPHRARPDASDRVRKQVARRLITVRGRWWLLVDVARWRLTHADGRVVKWTSPKRVTAEALLDLDGQKLTRVEVNRETGATRFDFDLGLRLDVWRMTRKHLGDDLWKLYKPNGYVLSARGDGSCHYRDGWRF